MNKGRRAPERSWHLDAGRGFSSKKTENNHLTPAKYHRKDAALPKPRPPKRVGARFSPQQVCKQSSLRGQGSTEPILCRGERTRGAWTPTNEQEQSFITGGSVEALTPTTPRPTSPGGVREHDTDTQHTIQEPELLYLPSSSQNPGPPLSTEAEGKPQFSSPPFRSIAQSCPTPRDPVDCSTPGLPVIANSRSLLKPMSIELVMPSNCLILCHPLLLPPPIFPSIRGEGYLAVIRLCCTFPCRAVIVSLAKTQGVNNSRVS